LYELCGFFLYSGNLQDYWSRFILNEALTTMSFLHLLGKKYNLSIV